MSKQNTMDDYVDSRLSLTCYCVGNTYDFSHLLLLGIPSQLTAPAAVLLYKK